ncbi:MAG TPA: hypothetical protein VFD73_15495, partial [Gemmatimonadales bacterium]|nr:hypothetical protein [Gemmatimonadales bacterium]
RSTHAEAIPGPVLRALESDGSAADVVDASPETAFWRAEALLNHARTHPQASSLDVAIDVLRGGLRDLADGDEGRRWLLAPLSLAHWGRFERIKSRQALEELIETLRLTVDAIPAGDPDRSQYLTALADALCTRADASREMGYIGEAAAAVDAAIEELPPEDPRQEGARLHALAERCRQWRADLAVDGNLGEAMRLINHGISMWSEFERSGNPAVAEQAITEFRTAVALAGDNPNHRGVMLANLGVALKKYSAFTSRDDLLDEAAEVLAQAVEAVGPDPQRPTLLANLALARQDQFLRDRDPGRAQEAMSLMRQALADVPPGTPDRGKLLPDAGQIWANIAEVNNDPALLDEFLPELREAVTDKRYPRQQSYALYTALASILGVRAALSGDVGDVD